MLSFLRLLRQRYTQALDQSGDRDPGLKAKYPRLIQSLALSEAALLRETTGLIGDSEPLHLGVFGPTQSGKSSLINWMSALPLAVPSPLAGFTVHPQGFSAPRSPGWLDRLGRYFEGYERKPSQELRSDALKSFGFDTYEASRFPAALQGSILWDTPDFDSVAASRYEEGVHRIAALMDVVILIVSKDKYGDLTVWEFLNLIEPMAQPIVLVLNKTDADSEGALRASVADKWRQFRSDPLPEIVSISYSREDAAQGALAERQRILLAAVNQAASRVIRHEGSAKRLINRHWEAWIAPITEEHRLTADWQDRIDIVIADCLSRYQRDYLNHPNHYETFQRALGELLNLLEVPGIGAALHSARRAVTWPMRQLARLGQSAAGRVKNSDGVERGVLHQLAQHALLQLSEELLLEPSDDPAVRRWRGGLSQVLSNRRAALLGRFDLAAEAYVEGFRPEIEATAQSLYAHLQDHPVVLNSLRATRVTTDAAALGVALHTGGIGVQDFVIAPAVLSMTSMLTESALGHFMSRAQEQLKRRQLETVEILLRQALHAPLVELPLQIDTSYRLGISDDQLSMAQALKSHP
jgi:GTP-binding protein EngB required for normal cell division